MGIFLVFKQGNISQTMQRMWKNFLELAFKGTLPFEARPCDVNWASISTVPRGLLNRLAVSLRSSHIHVTQFRLGPYAAQQNTQYNEFDSAWD